MTNQIAERMVVSVTVQNRGEDENGFRFELDVPQFHSNYPTIVTRVKEATAKLLAPRPEPYSVVLVRQNLKKDKKGDRPYDYYWGLDGLATPAETQAKAAAVTSEPPAAPRQSWDDRTVDIEAAWAINQARELYQWIDGGAEEKYIEMGELVNQAQWFLDAKLMLTNAMRSGVRLGQFQDTPPAAQDATPEPSAVVSGERTFATLGDLYMAAQQLGFPTVKSRLDVPGFQQAVEARDYSKAYGLLQAAKAGK